MLAYFTHFSNYLRLSLSDGKGAKSTDRGTCIEAADIRSTCTKDICANGTSAEDAFFARDTCIKSTFVAGICNESIYTGIAYTIKYLGIKLHFSGISGVELFGMG